MAVNRGARGWEALPFNEPQRAWIDNTAELQAALQVAMAQTEARRADGIVDLVQVNGTWMTPEDANGAD